MTTTIREIMIRHPVTLRVEQSLFSAREMMVIHDYECLFVVDEGGRPVGILTSVDMSMASSKKTVGEILRPEYPRLEPGQTVQEAAQLFATGEMQNLAMAVVGEGGELEGVVRVRDIVKDLAEPAPRDEGDLSPEQAVLFLAMSRSEAKEKTWVEKIRQQGMHPAVTQVGANAEKLPIKLRESAIVAAIAYGVIRETEREKSAVSRAVGEVLLQLRVISPGLGGGYKVGVVRGDGRVSVAVFGRSGHALVNSREQSFLGSSTI